MGVIGALLGRVPVLVWAVAGALAWGAWQRHLATQAQLELRRRDAEISAAAIQGLQRRLDDQAAIIKGQANAGLAAERARDAAEVARLDAVDAVGRLQRAARSAAARACAGAAPAPAVGASGAAPGVGAGPEVLADVLGVLAEAGGRAAAAVDAARIRGVECEQRYDATVIPR